MLRQFTYIQVAQIANSANPRPSALAAQSDATIADEVLREIHRLLYLYPCVWMGREVSDTNHRRLSRQFNLVHER